MKKTLGLILFCLLFVACDKGNDSRKKSITLSEEDLTTATNLSGKTQEEVAQWAVSLGFKNGVSSEVVAQALDEQIKLSCEETCILQRK